VAYTCSLFSSVFLGSVVLPRHQFKRPRNWCDVGVCRVIRHMCTSAAHVMEQVRGGVLHSSTFPLNVSASVESGVHLRVM